MNAEGQTLCLAPDLVDLTRLTFAQSQSLPQDGISCPRCYEALEIFPDKEGRPVTRHLEDCGHEVETRSSLRNRVHLENHLKTIFPGAVIATDVDISEETGSKKPLIADVVVVTGKGARLVVMVWGREEHTKKELERVSGEIDNVGLHPMWLLDGERLKKAPEETQIMSVTVKKTETALFSLSQPLLYLGPGNRCLYRLFLPVALKRIMQEKDLKSIGQVKAAVRPYQLKQLRVRNGVWSVESEFDAPLPPPPPLPVRLTRD